MKYYALILCLLLAAMTQSGEVFASDADNKKGVNKASILTLYLADVEKHINRGLAVPSGSSSDSKTTVTFTIQKDGNPKDIKITESSTNAAFDDNAVKTIQLVAPFRAVPKPDKAIDAKAVFQGTKATVTLISRH